ncbi:OmpH family outer membrane protein [Bacteroidota bacterium]
MKNLNYIISGILGVAVCILFIMQTVNKDKNEAEAITNQSKGISGDGIKIAYFKVDSVLAKWDLYFAEQEKLTSKQKQLEADFENKSQGFMKRVEDANYKVQRGLVTRAEAEQLQQQLAAEEQNLLGLQNDYTLQMQEEGVVKNRQMIDKLEQFLKKYNKEKGYDYIFSYTFGGNLLFGHEAYDITDDVIEGINKTYPAE